MDEESLADQRYWIHNQRNGAIAFAVLTTFIVSLRCIVRGLLDWRNGNPRRLFKWEDLFILASLITFWSLCACAIVNAQGYLSSFSGDDSAITLIFKTSYGISVVYPVACVLPKLSICCIYLSLFSIDPYTRRITYAVMVFLVANAIAWFVPSVVVCIPVSAYFYGTPAKCINYDLFGVWISLPHIVSDLVIFCLPLPLLWRTHLKYSKKIGLTITFLAGSIGIVGACIRLALYIHRYYVAQPGAYQTTRSIAGSVIVSYVEPGMYLVAACLPRLRPLIRRLHESLSSSYSSLMGKRQPSDDPSPSPSRRHRRRGSDNIGLVPRVNVSLTGRGNLDTLAAEYEDPLAAPQQEANLFTALPKNYADLGKAQHLQVNPRTTSLPHH